MTSVPESQPAESGQFGDIPLLRGEVAFRLLVEAVQDYAIFLLGPDGRVLTWNLGAQRIKGYTAEEIIGQHFSRFYTPEEREAGRPMTLLGYAAEFGRFEDEGWRVRKDGTRFWADVVMTALVDESGKPYAFAKITRDLTERRASEDQRVQLVAERRAREAAEEALQARDRFLSIASHELKTPVASLQLATENLIRARESGRMTEQRLSTGLERMTRATRRLGQLVQELLDIARLTAQRTSFVSVPVDVVELARDVVSRFAIDETDSRIRLDAPDEVWISGDANRLDQVLANLVDNALKYSAPPAPVDIEIRAQDDGVRITVLDQGVGLDAAETDRIFEPFGRGERAEHVQGMGLGLYISQQIVNRHGGRISAVQRDGGRGAAFSVWLPREQPPPEDEPQ